MGNLDRRERIAIEKGTFANGCHSIGELHRCQDIAIGEGPASYLADRARDFYRREFATTKKRSFINQCDRTGNLYRLHVPAFIERHPSDGCHCIRDYYRHQTAAVRECPFANGTDRIVCSHVCHTRRNGQFLTVFIQPDYGCRSFFCVQVVFQAVNRCRNHFAPCSQAHHQEQAGNKHSHRNLSHTVQKK